MGKLADTSQDDGWANCAFFIMRQSVRSFLLPCAGIRTCSAESTAGAPKERTGKPVIDVIDSCCSRDAEYKGSAVRLSFRDSFLGTKWAAGEQDERKKRRSGTRKNGLYSSSSLSVCLLCQEWDHSAHVIAGRRHGTRDVGVR